MPKFSTFIFDVDGTLAHTNKLIFESFRHVAKKYLNKEVSDEEIVSLFGPTEDVILKEWMNDNYTTAREDYYNFYSEQHNILANTFQGMDEILDSIKSSNKNLAIFTGKGRESTRITLEKIGYENYFELIVSGDDVENHKPAPDGILKILDHYKLNNDEVLMIGDSQHDVEASKSANVKIASVIWDSYAKDEVLKMNPDY
ncbi:MAG TPA: HAD family hydrolase, partial [Ignavibacteria bacterium]|nr:HAD family hydrolase [Ignavibacteria bacterium]